MRPTTYNHGCVPLMCVHPRCCKLRPSHPQQPPRSSPVTAAARLLANDPGGQPPQPAVPRTTPRTSSHNLALQALWDGGRGL